MNIENGDVRCDRSPTIINQRRYWVRLFFTPVDGWLHGIETLENGDLFELSSRFWRWLMVEVGRKSLTKQYWPHRWVLFWVVENVKIVECVAANQSAYIMKMCIQQALYCEHVNCLNKRLIWTCKYVNGWYYILQISFSKIHCN